METSLVSSPTCWEEQEFQHLPLSLQLETALAPSVAGELVHIPWQSPPPGLGTGRSRERARGQTRERSAGLPVVGLSLVTLPPGLRSLLAAGEPVPTCVAGDISGCQRPANQGWAQLARAMTHEI